MILPLELFGQGIDFLLDHPEGARTLGVAGADHWRACYTWDVIGPRYARVLRGQPVSDLEVPAGTLDDTEAVRRQFYDGRVGQQSSAWPPRRSPRARPRPAPGPCRGIDPGRHPLPHSSA